jgi:NIMA (never in mitosis gene a)-related kinase
LNKIKRNKQRGSKIPENEIWNYFIQIIKGLKSLHECKIFHRDVKAANIFLDSSGKAKVGDMNVSKVAKNAFCMTQTGTPY